MRKLARRIAFVALGVLALVILLPSLLLAFDALIVATGAYDDRAVAKIGKSGDQIIIVRRPIWHPILSNEFRRTMILVRGKDELLRSEMQEDTGGYAMVHVYRLADGSTVLTDGIFCSKIDSGLGRISEAGPITGTLVFVGAFDDTGPARQFRFFPATERPLKPFVYVHPACLNVEA